MATLGSCPGHTSLQSSGSCPPLSEAGLASGALSPPDPPQEPAPRHDRPRWELPLLLVKPHLGLGCGGTDG